MHPQLGIVSTLSQPLIPSGANSLPCSSIILDTYQPGEFIFQCHVFYLFIFLFFLFFFFAVFGVWKDILAPMASGISPGLCPFIICSMATWRQTMLHAKSLHSPLTLCNLMDCNLPGPSVLRILQARILEWIFMPSSRGSSWPRDQTCVSCVLHWQVYSLPLARFALEETKLCRRVET